VRAARKRKASANYAIAHRETSRVNRRDTRHEDTFLSAFVSLWLGSKRPSHARMFEEWSGL
jgi:hypothetical protein